MLFTTFSVIYNSIYYTVTFLLTTFLYLHSVLPFGLDVGLLGVAAYLFTKLPKPDSSHVHSIFGPEPGSKESQTHPEKVVKCIAHRGAGLDAPENTMQAFKYCVSMDCNFVEMDVRTSKDGQLVLLHDQGLERLTGTDITDVRVMDWESIKNIDVGVTHPNRHQYKDVTLCLLEDAIDYLLANKVRMIIDVKGEDHQVVNGIVRVFASNPVLYEYAVVTSFNPYVLYQIRKKDPNIVGAISYRPYCFSAANYDAESGPTNPRFGNRMVMQAAARALDTLHAALWRWSARWCAVSAVLHKDIVSPFGNQMVMQAAARALDTLHAALWRWSARWCAVSAVLLHKDIVSPTEVQYWRSLGVRVAGWCVNRPVEKLYWRAVLRAPYLANTLIGEPEMEKKDIRQEEIRSERERYLEPEKKISSGQN